MNENKYYLVPIMLIAMGSHNWTPEDKEGYSTLLPKEDQWNVDMNYAAYQECKNPGNIFTYMNKE